MQRQTYFLFVVFALLASALACNLEFGSSADNVASEETVSPDDSAGQDGSSTGQGAAEDLFAPVPGGVPIVQTTPESGNGTHPVFAWEPVDGATRYMLFVMDAEGYGYWSWEGSTTNVILGGFDTPPSDTAEGPRLTGPLQWAVVALDADDSFIASSPLRSVVP